MYLFYYYVRSYCRLLHDILLLSSMLESTKHSRDNAPCLIDIGEDFLKNFFKHRPDKTATEV